MATTEIAMIVKVMITNPFLRCIKLTVQNQRLVCENFPIKFVGGCFDENWPECGKNILVIEIDHIPSSCS